MTVEPTQELKRAPLDLEGNKCRLSAAALHVPAQDEPRSKRPLCLHTLSLHFEDVVLYRSSNAKSCAGPSDSALSAYKAAVGHVLRGLLDMRHD